MVVVVIIVILIGILIPSMGHVRNSGFKASTTATLGAIQTGLNQYYNDFGFFPPSSEAGWGAVSSVMDSFQARNRTRTS